MEKEELKRLKRVARYWAEQYDSIREVSLYQEDPKYEYSKNIIVIKADPDKELEKVCADPFGMLGEIGTVIKGFSWEEWIVNLNDDFFIFKPTRTVLYTRRDLSAPRKTRNELHEIIWEVYCKLKEMGYKDPKRGHVWNYLEKHWKDYDDVIQEIRDKTIYWRKPNGKDGQLTYNSLRNTLNRLKEKRSKKHPA